MDGSSLGTNPDISQIYKMGAISKEVDNKFFSLRKAREIAIDDPLNASVAEE
jgi:hypothetical protein